MKHILFTAAICTALTLQAQDDDPFAAFAELEAEAAAKAEEKEAGPIGKLAENLSGSVELQGIHYFNDRTPMPGGDTKNNFWDLTLDLETWTAGDNWKIGGSVWLQNGNQDDTFHDTSFTGGHAVQDLDEEEHRYLTLDELYLILNFNSWDLTLGKKHFPNGLSVLYSPADNLTPVAGYDPLAIQDLGIWQIRADWYKDEYTWTFALLPFYQPNKVPPSTSRWIIDTSGNPAPSTEYPSKSPDNFGYFGRVKTTKNGWDLFASCYVGPGRQYVVKQIGTTLFPPFVVLERRVPKVINPAAGYSTTHDAWEFHGEIAYIDTLHGEDEDYISCVQGTTYTMDGDNVKKLGLEKIDTTLEAAWEWTVGDQTAANYTQNSSSSRTGQRDLIGRMRFKISEELDVEYIGHVMFKRWGYMNRVECNWEFMNNLTWTTGLEFFGGNDKSGNPATDNLALTYGNWRRNNRFITSLTYEF